MSVEAITKANSTGLKDNLASLACEAAIEIDNLLLGRKQSLVAVVALIDAISSSVTKVEKPTRPNSLLDPTTAIALNRAIQATYSIQALKRLDELVREADRITGRLVKLVETPTQFLKQHPDELRRMKAFCLALSRSASALMHPIQDLQPEHPFRR